MPTIPSTPHLSKTTVAGGLVFVSGQFGLDAHGQFAGDVGTQTRLAIQAIEIALQPHGLSLGHVAKTTAWLSRLEDMPAFNAAYAEAFGAHRPARSTLVCELVRTEALVEIEAVAAPST